ncbi:MAG: bifunctional hydroxymethylpyrimidine kinase/phosphomethylpyrimidine kinase [Thermoprotei archaeon]|nr:MAG: bifunctional hydroxymethylpyrimidine kinase/phosphomethylpyrimidine kinase [Thermoprotei archaeon]
MSLLEGTLGRIPVAMTIAGSDSGGGAGIEADLKTFAALGVHGTVVLTAITAQNTFSVTGVQDVELDLIEKQIDAVVEDLGVDAAKTGMLHTSSIIETVARKVKEYGFPLVVDPVMVAKSGAPLLREEAVDALKKKLLPVATVVTPNAREAEVLAGIKISSKEDMVKAAEIIASLGPEAVVVKGGHVETLDEAVDILYYKDSVYEYSAPKVESRNTHGTGCTFSAAIAAELAKGTPLTKAVETAKNLVRLGIVYGIPLGRGHGPVNSMAYLYREASRYRVLKSVEKAVEILTSDPSLEKLAPEVGMNIAEAIPYALNVDDVVAVPGRLRKTGKGLTAASHPDFGASSHLARYILAIGKYDPSKKAAVNIRYSEKTVEVLKEMGLVVSFYDRREEPMEIKSKEGMTVPWGVEQAVKRVSKVPDVIYHLGDWGKEPMIVIFGRNSVEVAKILVEVMRKAR